MITFERFDENNILITGDHDPNAPGYPGVLKSKHYFPSDKWRLFQEVMAKYSTDEPTYDVRPPDYSTV